MGIRQAGLPLGGAVGAALLPLLASRYGWPAAFLAGGLIALLGVAIFVGLYRAPVVSRSSTEAPKNTLGEVVRFRLRMLRSRPMVNIFVTGLALITVQYGFQVFSVLHVLDVTNVAAEQAALLLFVALCAGVAGRISLAYWSDRCRYGRFAPVLVCMGAVVVGMLWLMLTPLRSVWAFGFAMAWVGYFGFGWYGPWVAYVAESAPPGRSGFALGSAMAVNQVAVVSTPPLLGLLRDTTHSYTAVWGVLGLITVGALLACGFLARR